MKYQNQLEKIRDLELELEDAYAELEEALLKEKANGAILHFIKVMFENSDNIPQFRYLIDTFISYKFHQLKLGDKLSEEIVNDFETDDIVGTDKIVQFQFTYRNEKGENHVFLDIEFDENHLVTRFTAYKG